MSFFEVMVNLLVGISGGIFSSIIVSRIFLIITDYSEQVSRVQERVEVTYVLEGALLAAQAIFSDGYNELGEKYKQELNNLIDSENAQYNKMIFDDLEKDLHALAIEYSDFMLSLKADRIDKNEVDKRISKLNKLTNKFNTYKSTRKKRLIRLFMKDATLRVLFSIFGIIVILTMIA